MLACTCTNTIYERVRPPANLSHQPKSDHQSAYTINQNPTAPTTARTSSNPSSRPVRNKTGTLSGEKLASCPEQTCHCPRFWPDSHCLKTCFWTKLNSQRLPLSAPILSFYPETKASCRSSSKKIVSRSKNGRRKVGTTINLCHRPRYQSAPSTFSHGMGLTMLLVKAQGLHFAPLKMRKICHLVSSSYVFFFYLSFRASAPLTSYMFRALHWIPTPYQRTERS